MRATQVFSVVLGTFLVAPSAIADVWTNPVPLTEVNSSAEEWSPFLSCDGLTLYFARIRSQDSYYGRIYEAKRDTPSGPFTTVQEVRGPLNGAAGHVVCAWVSPDNLRMYYHTEIGQVFALQVSERSSVDAPWPQGTPIPGLNSLGRRLQMPRLTLDERTVFFDASDIPGGQGGYDLWMATRPDRNSPFGNVMNLNELNTPANELPGFITPDGLTLYFSSDRDGSYALFQATRGTTDSPFGPPVHLSLFDVPGGFSIHPGLASDGGTLYFVAQQGSDRSTRDIWVSYADVLVPVKATLPQPVPGATGVDLGVTLSWRPGHAAVLHQVYFGADKDAVAGGTAPTVTLTDHRYSPASLQFGTAYYWKVNEINDAASTKSSEGDVWSFTTKEYATVDDFESYSDDEGSRINETWIDGSVNGTNSVVGYVQAPFAEQTLVHRGRQSMPLEYDNTKTPYYSESERDFVPVQNWTVNGATDLSLWFRGRPAVPVDDGNDVVPISHGVRRAGPTDVDPEPGNSPDKLYAAIEDNVGKIAVVTHPDSAAVNLADWTQWTIPLSRFPGVNLAKVKKLYIGAGGRKNPVPDGTGRIYIDNIGFGHPAQ